MYIDSFNFNCQNLYQGQTCPQSYNANTYSTNYSNISMRGKGNLPKKDNFIRKFLKNLTDKIPEKTIKDGDNKKRYKITSLLSNPAGNRLILGAAAVSIQPFIDLSNKKVDEDTRKISANRTLAKAIVCTAVGCLVRGANYKAVKMMTEKGGAKKYSEWLIPKRIKIDSEEDLETYRNTISTFTALAVMFFTNFLLDAPLTTIASNRLNRNNFKKLEAKNAQK